MSKINRWNKEAVNKQSNNPDVKEQPKEIQWDKIKMNYNIIEQIKKYIRN